MHAPDHEARLPRQALFGGSSGAAGRDRVEGGTHTDALFDLFPDRLRPLTPCHRTAFTALERWIATGDRPPASRTVPLPAGADANWLVDNCPLTARP
ncbi:hypothetical protein [Streptomyces durbertensis]|uniref:hypothetical protein n=1 Tax=Streptomyces durbertensis TaxID=2448886 RepID=UPI003F694E3A